MADILSAYTDRLDALLDLAPLPDQTRERPGIRVLYQPSFDAEVAITVLGGPTPTLSVVALSGSAWYHLLASSMAEVPESFPPHPKQPERQVVAVPLPESVAEKLVAAAREALPLDCAPVARDASGLDGMPVTISHAEAGRQITVERWSPHRNGDGPDRLALAVLGAAMCVVPDSPPREALARIGRYVPGDDDG